MRTHATIERLVESQGHRVEQLRPEHHDIAFHPPIALSRLPGAGGELVARRLCEDLRYDLYDRQIVHAVAESAQLSDRLVESLDEKQRSLLTDWLTSLASAQHLSTYGYRYHLSLVVGALARRGRVVIVGRGAHLILGAGRALRVLVVAPLDARVASVAAREQIGEREARLRVAAREAERRAFLQQYFHADPADLNAFDVVVNTSTLGVEGAAKAIEASLPRLARSPGTGAGSGTTLAR